MKTTDAFRTAVISMQKNMLSIARKLTLNEEEAYDLVQDTTLKALDNESKYVDKSNFGGWIMTIMRNIFVNNYHRRAREVSIFESSGDLYNLNIPGETVMESPDGSFAASQIDEMIKTFPEDYRKPFEILLHTVCQVPMPTENLQVPYLLYLHQRTCPSQNILSSAMFPIIRSLSDAIFLYFL